MSFCSTNRPQAGKTLSDLAASSVTNQKVFNKISYRPTNGAPSPANGRRNVGNGDSNEEFQSGPAPRRWPRRRRGVNEIKSWSFYCSPSAGE